MNQEWKDKILKEYCDFEMKKLKQLCYPKITKIGGISQMDHDDLFSIALEVLYDSVEKFDGRCKFETFLSGNISRKFSTYIRNRNTVKRSGERQFNKDGSRLFTKDISLDEVTNDGLYLVDSIATNYNLESIVMNESATDGRAQELLDKLCGKQKAILQMLIDGNSTDDIKKKLNLSDEKYNSYIKDLLSFKKIRMIKEIFPEISKYNVKESEEEEQMVTTQTAEKSKPMTYSIAAINKKIDNKTIRFDHPLQRESDQWSPSMKGNLISDILQQNPLPEIVFAEQIINGIPVIWDLDGKQRCTNCYSFVNDGFKVSKNIRRWNIQYIAQIKDENGNPILDENNFPMSEYREFDIRNKKFSQLPEELQDRFLEYTFKCDQYLNCDSDEIAYHIIRYNEGKPMTKPQKGITRLGEEFASMVKSISAMPFFNENGGYTVKEAKNGTLERVVIESVMASKYIDSWKKQQEDMCDFLRENAQAEDFDDFEDAVTKLNEVITDEVSPMFNSKDSFLYFGLYARFVNIGEDDKRFIEFLAELSQSLHSKEINGVSFDSLNINQETGKVRTTKDRFIVEQKMNHLVKLMNDYLGTSGQSSDTKFVEDFSNSDLMYETNMSKDDIKNVALDVLNAIDDRNEAMQCANRANEWLLNSENRNLAINRFVLPAIVMLVKYVFDLKKSDDYGIEALNKFLHSGIIANNVEQNYTGLIACAT